MDPQQGLYWPTRRSLFRRHPSRVARVVLWVAVAAGVLLAAADFLGAS